MVQLAEDWHLKVKKITAMSATIFCLVVGVYHIMNTARLAYRAEVSITSKTNLQFLNFDW